MSKNIRAHQLSLACVGFFFLLVVASRMAHANAAVDVDQLLANGRYQEAQAMAESVLSRQPRDMQMRFVTGVIQFASGKPDDAIRTFKALAEEHPQLPEPHNNLAVIFAGRGQFEEAREALEKAIQTNPSYARAHENLGDIHAKLASQAYSSALRLDGNNTGIAPKLSLIQSLFSANEGRGHKKAAAMSATAPVTVGPVRARQAQVSGGASSPAGLPTSDSPPGSAPPPPDVAGESTSLASGNSADPAAEVDEAVRAWALAWSRQDISAYLGSYGQNFVPQGQQSRSAWEIGRRTRITGKSGIRVEISSLKVIMKSTKANVLFRQQYQSGPLRVFSKKMLAMEKSGDRWFIVKEASYDE